MFESTKWILKESDCMDVNKYDAIAPVVVKLPENNFTENINEEISEIGIIQQYQFSSSLQRMSVIVRVLGSDDFRAYTKGSPEMIINLSKTETVPNDISLVLERYTRQGYRVIAMGRRTISENNAEVIYLVYQRIHLYIIQRWDISRGVHTYVPGIEIISRSGRAGLGVLGTSRSRKPTETTDGISDYGIKRSQYTRSNDYGFDQIIFHKFSFHALL